MQSGPFGLPGIPDAVRKGFVEKGYDAILVSYYTTKTANLNFKIIDDVCARYLPRDSICGIAVLKESPAPMNTIRMHFDGGEIKFHANMGTGILLGSYLAIICPLDSDAVHLEEPVKRQVSIFIATLSLLHGEMVGMHEHLSCIADHRKGIITFKTLAPQLRQTLYDEAINDELVNIIASEDGAQLVYNERVFELVSRSHHEQDNSLKFMFMWLAIEAVIGRGRERGRFCLNTMTSARLNRELENVANKRNRVFHEGLEVSFTQKEYLFTKCVVIMASTSNISLRQKILEYCVSNLFSPESGDSN